MTTGTAGAGASPHAEQGLKRRMMLKIGGLVTAATGASALSQVTASRVEAAELAVPGLKPAVEPAPGADSAIYASSERRRDVRALGKDLPTPKRLVDGRAGDGSDGPFVTNGVATITKDSYYTDVRIGPQAVVTVARGVTIHCAGELNVNGKLLWQASDGQNASGTKGGPGGAIPAIGPGAVLAIGGASGQPGQNGGAGAGANGTQASPKTTHGGSGGTGGSGGASSSAAGGAGAAPIAKVTPVSGLRTLAQAQAVMQATALASGQGGSGAGSGAGDGTNSGGGGGGAGSAGAFGLVITSQLSGYGTISVPGGKGGSGASGVGGNAGGGGGGAGGGGGILVVTAHDTSKWSGLLSAPGGAGGAGGAGAGAGAAGTAGTAGTIGAVALLSLNSLKSSETNDMLPVLAFTGENAAPLQSSIKTLDSMPIRLRSGPSQQVTIGANVFIKNGLYSPNSGWAGPNNGGAAWIMDYYTDADAHSIGMFSGNGKFRLKVDGEWVNDYTAVPYAGGSGGINWLQVAFSKRRQMRHFEWHLSSVPVRGISTEPTSTIYPATAPLDIPRGVVGDSFTQGASGGSNSQTWEMGGYIWQLAELMGWDNLVVSGQGGTGYTNNGGFGDGRKTFPQVVLDSFGPLPAHLMPKSFLVAGGYNDGDAVNLQTAAAATFGNIATVAPGAAIDVAYFSNNGAPAAGYLSGRTKIKTAALESPNVRSFIDGITGEVIAGPACRVTVPPFVAMPFLTGNGRLGAPNGSGNSDFFVSSDGIHPSYPEGHRNLALRLKAALLMVQPQA